MDFRIPDLTRTHAPEQLSKARAKPQRRPLGPLPEREGFPESSGRDSRSVSTHGTVRRRRGTPVMGSGWEVLPGNLSGQGKSCRSEGDGTQHQQPFDYKNATAG